MAATGNCLNQSQPVAHLIHSPNDALSDLFLLGHLRDKMAGFTASSAEDIPSVLRRIFERLPKEVLIADGNEWITKYEWITEHTGEDDQTY
jgi:hypothetical protein